jgi:LemA protein
LKRQSELIPNLEASVKGYLKHEKGILEMLADARKSASKGKDTSKALNEVLPKLQILVESNPELKGNTVVQNLMDDLRDTSDKVMYSRRLFIDLTADYNVKRVTFPTNLIASMFNFPELKGFDKDIDSEELKTPKISL